MNKENNFEAKTPLVQPSGAHVLSPLHQLPPMGEKRQPAGLRQRSVDLDAEARGPIHEEPQAFITVGDDRRRNASNSIDRLTSLNSNCDVTSILHSSNQGRYIDRVYEQLRAHVHTANDESLRFPAAPFKTLKEALRYSVSLAGKLALRCQGVAAYRRVVASHLSGSSWTEDMVVEQAREQLEKEQTQAAVRDQDVRL